MIPIFFILSLSHTLPNFNSAPFFEERGFIRIICRNSCSKTMPIQMLVKMGYPFNTISTNNKKNKKLLGS